MPKSKQKVKQVKIPEGLHNELRAMGARRDMLNAQIQSCVMGVARSNKIHGDFQFSLDKMLIYQTEEA